MRLILLSHSINPWTPEYARFFQARGDEVLVVSYTAAKVPGVPLAFIGVDPWDGSAGKYIYLTRIPRLRRIIKEFQPDLVFAPFIVSNGLSAVLAWRGPTATAGVGGDVLEQPGRTGWRHRVRQAVVRFVCHRSQLVQSVSGEISTALRRLGVPDGKLIELPVGTDTTRFTPQLELPRRDATRLVCVRKHEPVYNNDVIIDALAILKAQGRRFTCVMASQGSLWQATRDRARAARLDDCVTFPGELPHDQLPRLLRDADIYVSATLSDGTSCALLEGLATGLLPVVSRISANTSWVEHGRNGLLFDPHDADELARMLAHAMDDVELRRRAASENPGRARERGDQHRNMTRLAEAFERVLASR